jgi:hypothetical protein
MRRSKKERTGQIVVLLKDITSQAATESGTVETPWMAKKTLVYMGEVSKRAKELGTTWDEAKQQMVNEKQTLDWHPLGQNSANQKYLQERGYRVVQGGKSAPTPSNSGLSVGDKRPQ